MGIPIIHSDSPLTDPRVRAVRDVLRAGNVRALTAGLADIDVASTVREIVEDVRERSDDALVEWTRRLDRVGREFDAGEIRVLREKLAAARAGADPQFLALVRRVADNIRRYQRHILVEAPAALLRGGRELGVRYTPVGRVGVYVPGGEAMYPSTVLMTVVPAQVAGVPQIAVASPPRCEGEVNEMVLALAAELGIDEVYRMGGAQAIAAFAFGTKTVKPVDKIVGPGNAFVAEAKRRVLGRVGIDSIAGPSEVLIIADETA